MEIEPDQAAASSDRIRLGMVGGGEGAFIGAVHRIATRLDDPYTLVAGAFSSAADKSLRSASLGLAADRIYTDYETMAATEATRHGDGIEAVAIVTPTHLHAPIATAFLKAGIPVICDKPVTTTVKDAKKLRALARRHRRIVAVTPTYRGYPMAPAAALYGSKGGIEWRHEGAPWATACRQPPSPLSEAERPRRVPIGAPTRRPRPGFSLALSRPPWRARPPRARPRRS